MRKHDADTRFQEAISGLEEQFRALDVPLLITARCGMWLAAMGLVGGFFIGWCAR